MGFSILKGIGVEAAKVLEGYLEKFDVEFDTDDFFTDKMNARVLNKRVIEALFKIGAFSECFENINDRMLWNAYLAWSKKKSKDFSEFVKPIKDFDFDERLAFENQFLGFYFQAHPLDRYSEILDDERLCTIAKAKKNGAGVVPVKIERCSTYDSPRAGKMAFLDISDKTDRTDVVVWSGIFDANYAYLKTGELVILKLRRSKRGGFELDGKAPVIRIADLQTKGR